MNPRALEVGGFPTPAAILEARQEALAAEAVAAVGAVRRAILDEKGNWSLMDVRLGGYSREAVIYAVGIVKAAGWRIDLRAYPDATYYTLRVSFPVELDGDDE